jgi:UDP-4-amino-4,6-dideoxy-N-acetyl-beta-L-altrosamine transaminase/dTDP-4-dehydrorhamnose reductase
MGENKKKILITGVSGLLGNNLAYYFRNAYTVLGFYYTHPVVIDGVQTKKVDIFSEETLKVAIGEFRPDIVIHCASLTDVDFCENHRDLTTQANVDGSKLVVNSLKKTDARLIYISTDSVYDGVKGDFKEIDRIKPQNFYGLSKYRGEREILKRSGSLVLRTNIFGWNIQDKFSIAEWIINCLKERKQINGFNDAYFSSIYTFELARIIDKVFKKGLHGIYNCASRTSLSKYEFALELAKRFGLDVSLISPISIDDFCFKAKRGKNLSLNVDKLSRDLGCRLPTISNSIESFYQDFSYGLPDKIKTKRWNVNKTVESSFIPYGRQSIDDDDIKAVVDVLKSDWVTQGPKINEFEEALCKYTGAQYAVCVANGTAALHLACLAAGIRADDEVITSPITFVASANCILYCGGKPVFADVQRDTINIDPGEIINKVTERTKGIIPVHFAGHPCDLQEIGRIAKKNKLFVIEDAAHALGAEYKGAKIGSCKYSDMTIFSFHPVKSITTGEGGAVLTNSRDLYKKLVMLRSHGIAKNDFVNKPEGEWYYEMQRLGYNYRMTDIQAALGVSQLKKLDAFISRRRRIVEIYRNSFKDNPYFDIPTEKDDVYSAYHLYTIRLKEKNKSLRGKIFALLRKHGLGVQVHYIPVHLQPYYKQKFGYKENDFPVSEDYYNRALSLPLYPKMTDEEVKKVIDVTLDVFHRVK